MRTQRSPGPLNQEELETFQREHGLTVDGKFGDQSMGQVALIGDELERRRNRVSVLTEEISCLISQDVGRVREIRQLRKQLETRSVWTMITAGVAALGAWVAASVGWIF